MAYYGNQWTPSQISAWNQFHRALKEYIDSCSDSVTSGKPPKKVRENPKLRTAVQTALNAVKKAGLNTQEITKGLSTMSNIIPPNYSTFINL